MSDRIGNPITRPAFSRSSPKDRYLSRWYTPTCFVAGWVELRGVNERAAAWKLESTRYGREGMVQKARAEGKGLRKEKGFDGELGMGRCTRFSVDGYFTFSSRSVLDLSMIPYLELGRMIATYLTMRLFWA